MARLGVNIEAIAILRENGVTHADPLVAAMLAELGGADGIVCPLRDGMSYIRDRDLQLLKEVVKTHFNVQTPPDETLVSAALSVGPDMITLNPGKKPGSTPGGGLDILGQGRNWMKIIEDIRSQDIVVSILIDPNIHQLKAAAKMGVDFVELHLGPYSITDDLNERNDQLENLN